MTVLQLKIVLLPTQNQGRIQLLHDVLQVNWSAPSLQARLLLLLPSFLDQPGHLGLWVTWRSCWLPAGGDLDTLLVTLLKHLGTAGLVPGEHHHLAQGLPSCHHNCMFKWVEGKS